MKRYQKFLWLVPVLLAVTAHLSALDNGLVYDDIRLVKEMLPRLHTFWDVWFHSKLFFEPLVYYRPTFFAGLMFSRLISGYEPWGYHLILILIHAANSALVYVLSSVFLKNRPYGRWGALAAGALFATHPVHVEVVAWISAMVETLLVLFFLGSLLFYIHYRKNPRQKRWLILSLLAFAGALLSKEPAVAMLVLVPLYDFLFCRSRKLLPSKIEALSYAAFFGVFAVYYLLRQANVSYTPLQGLIYPPGETLLRLLSAFGYYMQKVIFPARVNPYISTIPLSSTFLIGGGISVTLFVFSLAASFKRAPQIFFHLILFCAALSPAALVALGATTTPLAERYVYLPSYGICFIFGWFVAFNLDFLDHKITTFPLRKLSTITLTVLLILTGSVFSYNRVEIWQDERSFWEQAARMNSKSLGPWADLGRIEMQSGNCAQAVVFFDKAISFKIASTPPNALAMLYVNKATCFHDMGRIDEALALLHESVKVYPYPSAYYNVGFFQALAGIKSRDEGDKKEHLQKAVAAFKIALNLDKGNAKFSYYLAQAYENLGEPEQAKYFYKYTLSLNNEGEWASLARLALKKL